MNALRGGAQRDVYALLYQLEHKGKRKNALQVSIAFIAERLGYSERNIQYAISELKSQGLIETEYTDGRRSVYKTFTTDKITPDTPAKIAPLSGERNPRKSCTPAGERNPRKICTPAGERNPRKSCTPAGERNPRKICTPAGERNPRKSCTPAGERNPRKICTPAGERNPRKSCRGANFAGVQDLRGGDAKFAPPTPYLKSLEDSIEDITTTTTTTESAQERLKKWVVESDLQEWVKMQLFHSGLTDLTLATLLAEFYDNDFVVRERCERGERTETLRHFQNWLPKFLRKLKNQNDNANPTTHRSSASQAVGTSRAGNSTSLDDIARSIAAGFAAGAARRE